ncbi:MAG TPA: hypothetical protein VNJ51_01655 [Candidatus Dormibacteraeota bacterium]|nr:hypothetical protein [Candidatus Dormibacteraeota bacterium]
MSRSTAWWVAATIFGAVFLYLSLQEGVYDFSVGLIAGPFHIYPRKIMATLSFSILSYCVARAVQGEGEPVSWTVPVTAGTLFSTCIEIAQHYWEVLLDRPIEPRIWNLIDIGTGAVGGLLAAAALAWTRRRAERAPRGEHGGS